jgi:hypothetical protein
MDPLTPEKIEEIEKTGFDAGFPAEVIAGTIIFGLLIRQGFEPEGDAEDGVMRMRKDSLLITVDKTMSRFFVGDREAQSVQNSFFKNNFQYVLDLVKNA